MGLTAAVTGVGGLVLLGCALVGLGVLGALTLLARSGRWAPAAVWLLPALLVFSVGQGLAMLVGRWAASAARGAGPDALVGTVLAGMAEALRIDALGLVGAASLLLVAGWLAGFTALWAAGLSRTRWAWLHATPVAVIGLGGAVVVGLLGGWLAHPLVGLALGGGLLAGMLGLTALSSRRPVPGRGARQVALRLGATRGMMAACATFAVLFLALATGEVLRAQALGGLLLTPLDHRPALVAHSLAEAQVVLALGLLGAGVVVLAGAIGVLLTPTALGSWRTVLGSLLVAVLGLGAMGVRAGQQLSLGALEAIVRGGAIGAQPLLPDLPVPRDLTGLAEVQDGIVGTCFVQEGPRAWQAQGLYDLLDQRAAILAHGSPQSPIEDLERMPGCPATPGPLEAPLSRYETPVIAVHGSRLAAAVTGHRWFLRGGGLRILLAPQSRVLKQEPPAVQTWRYRTVPLRWEMPPEAEPLSDGQTWDYEAAATLPITLLEGRGPVLVAGGSRYDLPPGEAGAEELREVLAGADRPDLVLVPRKHWTVQDLVDFCLTVLGHVEGARCVVRPENPDRWSQRTGLPLPWTTE